MEISSGEIRNIHTILGSFAKLRQVTVCFVTSVPLSVYPHATTQLQLHKF